MVKAPQSRTHRERAQPHARARLGLLEKHSDYVQRARHHRRSRALLQTMRVKAQYRNPNEFYFGMQSSMVAGDGTQRNGSKKGTLSADVVKVMKSQDLGYVRMMKRVNEGKLAMLAHGVGGVDGMGRRLVFVDSDDGDDVPVPGPALDERRQPPSTATNGTPAATSTAHSDRRRNRLEQEEVRIRQERLERLRLAERQLETQQWAMGRGKKEKLREDPNGLPVYRWAAIRQK